MKKNFKNTFSVVLCFFISVVLHAQSTVTISGNVKSSIGNESVSAVSIVVKGSNLGTFTDDRGNFKITGSFSLPVTFVFSSVGYATKEAVITDVSSPVHVVLDPVSALAQDVVVSASRLPERILESPVSIERISAATIRNSAAASYYDILGTLKGVDLTASSLNFKTPATRGFNTSGNLRLNQLVDGMDNQSPGLNFPVGTMNGLTELDVESMELLEGASSALYGPGGMNGTLLINSKDPFKYQGLSVQVRQGIMHIADDARKASPYYDYSFRWGQQVSQKFAFKLTGQFVYAKDWVPQNYSNYDVSNNPATGKVKAGNRTDDQNYNGVNVYGDETTADLLAPLKGLSATTPYLGTLTLPGLGVVPISTSAVLGPYTSAATLNVSRTGYKEADIINPETKNIRLSAGVYYKITPSIEASLSANWGSGTTVYTGSDRYSLRNFTIGQYKAEVKHKNWFLRAYTTQEDAGKSYNATVTTRLFNEAWKPSASVWYPQYIQGLVVGSATAYETALGQAYATAVGGGKSPAEALAIAQGVAPGAVAANQTAILNAARDYADVGRPQAGSAQFTHLFDSVASRSISSGGGLFIDKSSLYMAEGQYNLTDIVKVAEVLVGANFKQYVLNSEGTIFADRTGRIKISETGAYALVSKRLFNDVLKLTFSGRYDKNQNFAGHFTPRISAVITVAKNNNFRLSYQTAYRFPSTQNQWIDLGVGGGARLIGGLPSLRSYYHFDSNPVYMPESVVAFGASAQAGTPNPALLKQQAFGEYKPESASSYEIGYKTLIQGKFLIDLYGYYTEYKNFIGRINVLQSSDGTLAGLAKYNIFSVSVNSTDKVNTHGWGASAEYLLPDNFSVNANVFSDEITNVPANFIAQFNAPKYRANVGLSNTGFLYKKRVGFTVQYKYQGKVNWQGDFNAGNGFVPSYNTIDAQVNYKFPKIKSIVKLGATNLTNHYYITAFANPNIGGLYYVSFAYNVF